MISIALAALTIISGEPETYIEASISTEMDKILPEASLVACNSN